MTGNARLAIGFEYDEKRLIERQGIERKMNEVVKCSMSPIIVVFMVIMISILMETFIISHAKTKYSEIKGEGNNNDFNYFRTVTNSII